jgi:hypothetical protein
LRTSPDGATLVGTRTESKDRARIGGGVAVCRVGDPGIPCGPACAVETMKPHRFGVGLAVPFTVRRSRRRCGMRRWLLLTALNFAAWIGLFWLDFDDRPIGPELYLLRSIAIPLGFPLVPILIRTRAPVEVLLGVCLLLNPPLWAALVQVILWRFVDPPRDAEVLADGEQDDLASVAGRRARGTGEDGTAACGSRGGTAHR